MQRPEIVDRVDHEFRSVSLLHMLVGTWTDIIEYIKYLEKHQQ